MFYSGRILFNFLFILLTIALIFVYLKDLALSIFKKKNIIKFQKILIIWLIMLVMIFLSYAISWFQLKNWGTCGGFVGRGCPPYYTCNYFKNSDAGMCELNPFPL